MREVFTEAERKRRKSLRDKRYKANLPEERKRQYALKKREYDIRNKERITAQKVAWYRNMSPEQREKALTYRREYNRKNKEKLAQWSKSNQKRYYDENRESICKKLAERRRNDPLFKLAATYRVRTRKFLKKYSKAKKSIEILGCGWKELKEYIEKQFVDGMTWSNHGEWHIDHIKPLSKSTSKEELIERCHYTNLQPLWAVDNMRKSNK